MPRGRDPMTPMLKRQPPVFWWAVASFLLMVIGGFGPWATAFGVADISGTHGDGWFLIIGGVAGAGLVMVHATRSPAKRWQPIVAALVGAACTVVAIIDLSDVSSIGDTPLGDLVDPAWGLYVSLLASVSALAASAAIAATRAFLADSRPAEPATD